MEFEIKNVPTVFVTIGGESVEAKEVLEVLENFCDEKELRNYETIERIAILLVKEGVLEAIYEGLTTLYRIKENKTNFYYQFTRSYYDYVEENNL